MHLTVCGVDTGGWRLAEAVIDFFACVLPRVTVDAVSLTSAEIAEEFGSSIDADGAILCVTAASLAEERLPFALGLLHGRVGIAGFVAPLLLDLAPEDVVRTPLAVFQVTPVSRSEVAALVADINARSVEPGAPVCQHAFDQSWDAFYQRTRDIPGPAVTDFLISLALPSRIFSFRFDPGSEDASWEDSVTAVLANLPDGPFQVPRFDPGDLEALDVDASRWIEEPALLSRLPTSHIALVDMTLVDQWHGDPRRGARQIRESLPAKGPSDTLAWSREHVVFGRGVQ